jgi:two-component system chemotaxis response regulator CheB
LQPLKQLLADLPADLAASVFIVLHLGAASHLAAVLGYVSSLPVLRASSGEPIEHGRVYVGVPSVHLLLHDSHLLLRRGPRENLARPAIDPLFRSAACTFGGRVIGVVLSGALNDGAAGMRAIKRCGGIAVVQDPSEAAVAEMPLSALRYAKIDHVAPAAGLGALLTRLSREPAGQTPPIPPEIRLETAIAAQEGGTMEKDDKLGTPSRLTCPECHGTLWEVDDGSLLRYRCHVGHAFTAEVMLEAQRSGAEEMLWSLMRAHRERAALARRMAERARAQSHDSMATDLEKRALGYEEDAAVIHDLLRAHVGAEGSGRVGA